MKSNRLSSRTEARSDPNSCVPYCALSNEEMQARMKKLHNELRRIQKQRDRLKERLKEIVEKHGVPLDEQASDDFNHILQNEGCRRMERVEGNTFQHLFWKQQVEAASKKDPRGMRWHPLMIKWCIYLHYLSQGAYETMCSCISLPSQRTLRDYTHHLKPGSGFSAGVDNHLHIAARLDKCDERDKCVLLLLDEMHVKQDLVFNKSTGELIGFMNVGDINSHLLELERSLSSPDATESPLASTMVMFMVRGLFSRLEFPYIHFPCCNVTGDLLFDPFWEAVYRMGFKVRLNYYFLCCTL